MTATPVRLLLVALLIGINGFFAGAETALLSVRPSRLRQMAEEGFAGAQAALNLLSNPARLLSVTQVGVTLTSLALGWAGEDTVYSIIIGFLRPVETPLTTRFLHGVSFLLAFVVISYFHVVIGEVVPKNLAISKSDRLAALTAPALLLFYRLALPFVIVIERSAAFLSRALKLKEGAHGSVHSAEELKMIVSSSRNVGYLAETAEDMVHRVLDLAAISVREIMVPRHEMVTISSDATLDEVLHTMIEQKHSRLPVYEGAPETIIGILHYKDLLPVWEERRRAISGGAASRAFRIRRLLRPHMVVPETKPVSQMLEDFRKRRSHMAMVVDEFGTIMGLVTVEDVLEQIVGQIEDEHDDAEERALREAVDVEVEGTTRVRDLESEYGIHLPTDAGFETLAGFLLSQLGAIPHHGDRVEYEGRRYTILEMDRNRIARVRIEKLTKAEA
ncbi:MAG TPA: hemolysin family protein [Candidatus Acidoferrum sp.]|nr:hemolysin family protein [Candidatus Acidoferrum sp.]